MFLPILSEPWVPLGIGTKILFWINVNPILPQGRCCAGIITMAYTALVLSVLCYRKETRSFVKLYNFIPESEWSSYYQQWRINAWLWRNQHWGSSYLKWLLQFSMNNKKWRLCVKITMIQEWQRNGIMDDTQNERIEVIKRIIWSDWEKEKLWKRWERILCRILKM